MTEIKTKRFLLRPLARGDGPEIAHLVNDFSLARNTSRIPHPYGLKDAEEFIERSIAEFAGKTGFRFVVCDGKSVISSIGVEPVGDGAFEMGFWVGAPYRGGGVATEAARAVLDFAFGDLGAEKVTAGFFADNAASGRVLEKLGFERTGEVVPTYSLARGEEVDAVRLEIRRG